MPRIDRGATLTTATSQYDAPRIPGRPAPRDTDNETKFLAGSMEEAVHCAEATSDDNAAACAEQQDGRFAGHGSSGANVQLDLDDCAP